jgi:choline kinase
MQIVILAAGMGTRLGRPLPKPLTVLENGETIIGRQVSSCRAVFGADTEVLVVVGFKMDQVMEAVPEVTFAYNEDFDCTNTSKSLLRALRRTGDRGVLWMNGDVVFDPSVLERIRPLVADGQSFVCVNTASVADEEVKYLLDDEGHISELSKSVVGGLGEAVGINFISAPEKAALIARLDDVDDNDYFERGMELTILRGEARFRPIDISDYFAVEVDFEDDLSRANEHL